MSLDAQASRIRLVLLDVDGVLTDGKIWLQSDGSEIKRFDIKDGLAIAWAQRAGLTVGFLSARTSAATTQRAAQLGVTLVLQGVLSKLDAYRRVVDQYGFEDADVAFMGDDLLDLPVMMRVGLSAAPADAAADVRRAAHWRSAARGGDGAVRELLEFILRTQQRWQPMLDAYLARGGDEPAGTRGDEPGTASGT